MERKLEEIVDFIKTRTERSTSSAASHKQSSASSVRTSISSTSSEPRHTPSVSAISADSAHSGTASDKDNKFTEAKRVLLEEEETEEQPGEQEVVCSQAMYEQWPMLEFPDLSTGILDLFTRSTSESVASSLLGELTRDESDQLPAIRLNTEEQLRWCMQVLNHSLNLSFSSNREYETIKGAVRMYLHWLRALTDLPDSAIPTPLLDTPEKYFRPIIEALRSVFCRRADKLGENPRGLAIERQATEIENILDAVKALTHSASRKYQNEVWARSLSFMLNSADLLLADANATEEMGIRVGARVVDTLFEMWFRAVLHEEIPSPTYWRTLAVLCRRWRHHVTVIESWARKLLSMSVLVCRKMYGDDYSRILIHDDSVIPFGLLPSQTEEGEIELLYHCWYNLFSLFDSPAAILSHQPARNKPIHGGLSNSQPSDSSSQSEAPFPQALPLCFFLAVTAIQRMIDVFYGESRVPIEFKESDILMRRWTLSGPPSEVGSGIGQRRNDRERPSGHDSGRGDTDTTITQAGRSSFNSGVSGEPKEATSRTISDLNRKQVKRQSERSDKVDLERAAAAVDSASQPTRTNFTGKTETPSLSEHAASLPPQYQQAHSASRGESVSQRFDNVTGKTSIMSSDSVRPSSAHFVAHILAVNPMYPFYTCDRGPKAERLLNLTMLWLLEAANARSPLMKEKQSGDVSDDVISGLSLHSVELDDVPDAMSTSMAEARPQLDRKRTSLGSTSSSTTGHEPSFNEYPSSGPFDPMTVDGVSAGRAAALAALTRIICSKSTNERLPNTQLASYLSTLYQSLIEKDRIVLCSLFFYGHSLFRLGLPGVEAILPHYLFALDIVLIESSKLRLHPSIHEVEMRRCCLRALSSVVCWPTTFGMSRIPQCRDSGSLKSSAATYLHLRARIYKTLVFVLRNETDPVNLQMTLSMCTVLMEESCSFDLGLTEEQTKEMIRITTSTSSSSAQPEKGLCVSFVRGIVSAICDRLCRPEWAGEHSVSLAAIDVINAISQLHPTVLFSNNDVSTGSLTVASLCRFIETQLMKPPPLHSKDLHSTVVAAYTSIAVWLCAAPMLAECEGVLNTVAEAVQLGVTGSKKHEVENGEKKAASKRVLEAAEYVMYTLFCNVGRGSSWLACDERRLLYLYGPSAIDTTKFRHFLVNGDTLLSLHEASHIQAWADGCPTVLYTRRSPMQPASVGVARLRPHPPNYRPDQMPPPTPATPLTPITASLPSGSLSSDGASLDKPESLLSGDSSTSKVSSQSTTLTNETSGISRSTITSSSASVATGSILTGVTPGSMMSSNTTTSTIGTDSVNSVGLNGVQNGTFSSTSSVTTGSTATRLSLSTTMGEQFIIPQDFSKIGCKLDTTIRQLESTAETESILRDLQRVKERPQRQKGNVWDEIPKEERAVTPKQPALTCDSIRVLLYDMGLVDKEAFGSSFVQLDSGQSADFYRDLHDLVDSCPSRSTHTAHLFYVKEGQRSAVDILDNALNIQNTSADFCGFLSGLGEGIEVGRHDSWTGHWSTAYSSDRKPLDESEPVDHYIIDGVSHALWWSDSGCELAFLMPTERSLRMFKQDLASPAISSRRGSNGNKKNSSMSASSDEQRETVSYDSVNSGDGYLMPPSRGRGNSNMGSERDGCQPYGGGGSNLGQPASRRYTDLKVMLVWLERAEDLLYFPVDELQRSCDDGGDKPTASRNEKTPYTVIYLYQIEQGLIHVRTRGTQNRFGDVGPLYDGMVVSLACLPSFIRLTILNINRRNVAEIENFQFTHTKRKQAIVEFGKKYSASLTYEDFLNGLIFHN